MRVGFPGIWSPFLPLWFLILLSSGSSAITYNCPESEHPWRIPRLIFSGDVSVLLIRTRDWISVYRILIVLTNCLPKPNAFKVLINCKQSCSMRSNAFSWSRATIPSGVSLKFRRK